MSIMKIKNETPVKESKGIINVLADLFVEIERTGTRADNLIVGEQVFFDLQSQDEFDFDNKMLWGAIVICSLEMPDLIAVITGCKSDGLYKEGDFKVALIEFEREYEPPEIEL